MQPESVDLALDKARELCGGVWPEGLEELAKDVRRYALEQTEATQGPWLAYRLGRRMGYIYEGYHEAAMILMHLINQRAPGASKAQKDAARVVNPSMWDLLGSAD